MSEQKYRSYDDFSRNAIYHEDMNTIQLSGKGWLDYSEDLEETKENTPINADNLNAMLDMLINIRNVIGKTTDFDTKINSSTDNVSQPDVNIDKDSAKSIATYLKEAFDAIEGKKDTYDPDNPTLKGIVNSIGLTQSAEEGEEGYWTICFDQSHINLEDIPEQEEPTIPDSPVTPPAPQPTKLGTPIVTISADGVASWTAIPNAIKYHVLIYTGPITHANYETEELSVDLTSYLNSDVTSLIIRVKALGDGVNYKDSLYSAQQTYSVGGSLVQLATPAVTIGLNKASWDSVPNAIGYNYKINDGNEITTFDTSVSLNTGDSIIVKALGDAASYSDSEYSQIKYNIRLTIPVITISSTGLASWEPIENANNYYMVIRDGEDNIIKAETITSTEYQLTNKQSIAIFAMDTTDTYLMSFSSGSVRYNAPEGSSLVY